MKNMEEPGQQKIWKGTFGVEYTKRNALSLARLELLYKKRYGFTRTELNNKFLKTIPKDIKILEVGSNIGNQLALLQKAGWQTLFGIEINPFAADLARKRTKGINIINGSAFELPFRDNYFELVFTSGVLIHIAPEDLGRVMDEMYRVSSKYIWGLEYYSEELSPVEYRGYSNLLWKGPYDKLFMDRYRDLKICKRLLLPYLDSENVDIMYLLEKKTAKKSGGKKKK